jgi:hypothetical protein
MIRAGMASLSVPAAISDGRAAYSASTHTQRGNWIGSAQPLHPNLPKPNPEARMSGGRIAVSTLRVRESKLRLAMPTRMPA